MLKSTCTYNIYDRLETIVLEVFKFKNYLTRTC